MNFNPFFSFLSIPHTFWWDRPLWFSATHSHPHTHTHTHTHTVTHTHTHTPTYPHTHTHTHCLSTHTLSLSPSHTHPHTQTHTQTTLPIEVSVLPPEEDDSQDYEDLYEATRDLISAYNPMLGRTCRDNSSTDYSYASQTFSAVRKGIYA